MTAPGVPSPQEELRALAERYVTRWYADGEFSNSVSAEPTRLANLLCEFASAPLFAARVAAIEAQAWEHKEARAELNQRCTQYRERAERAEAELHNYKLVARGAYAADHRLMDRLQADLTAAQERIAELSIACRDGNRGCCVDGTCCACCDRAQRAEERVAAERTQAAAQALLAEAETWNGPDHRVWKPSQVAAELRRAAAGYGAARGTNPPADLSPADEPYDPEWVRALIDDRARLQVEVETLQRQADMYRALYKKRDSEFTERVAQRVAEDRVLLERIEAGPAERSGWEDADVADSRTRSHEYIPVKILPIIARSRLEPICCVCGLPEDEPIHQATPEETTP